MSERTYILSDRKIVSDSNSEFFDYETVKDGDILSIINQGVMSAIDYDATQIYEREKNGKEGRRLKSEIRKDLEKKYQRPLSQLRELMAASGAMKEIAQKSPELNNLIFAIEEAGLDQKSDIRRIVENARKQNFNEYYKGAKTAEKATEEYKVGKATLPTRAGIAKKTLKKEETIFYQVNAETNNMTLGKSDLEIIYNLQKDKFDKELSSSPDRDKSKRELEEYMEQKGYDKTDEEARKNAKAELDFSKISENNDWQNAMIIKKALANLRQSAFSISEVAEHNSAEELANFSKSMSQKEAEFKSYEDAVRTVCEVSSQIEKQKSLFYKLADYQQKGVITAEERDKISRTIQESIEKLTKQQQQNRQEMNLLREDEMKQYLENVSSYAKFNQSYQALLNSSIAKDGTYEAATHEEAMQFVKDTIETEIARSQLKTKRSSLDKFKRFFNRGNASGRENAAKEISTERDKAQGQNQEHQEQGPEIE